MTGGDALGAEIIFGLNDANPEILLPQSIHQDPGCQWILFRNDPSSQIQTIGDSLLDQRVKDGWNAGCDGYIRSSEIPLDEEMCLPGFLSLLEYHGSGHSGTAAPESLLLLGERLIIFVVCLELFAQECLFFLASLAG